MSRHALLPALLLLLGALVLPALSSVANTVEVGPEITPCPFTLEICSSVDKLYQQCALGPAAHVMSDQSAEIKKRLKKSVDEKKSLQSQLEVLKKDHAVQLAEINKRLKKSVDEKKSLTHWLEESRQNIRRLQSELEVLKKDLAVQPVCRFPNFQVGLQCFFLSYDKLSWTSAVTACRAFGGTLAEPNNLRPLIAKVRERTQERVYLGGSDRAMEGHWVGISGRPFNTRGNWDKGEPNSHLGEEDCIDIHTGQYGLNDVACHHTLRYVCEM